MLSDQVVLVSGAGGRLGSEIAKDIISHGGKVGLFDVSESSLQAVTRTLPERSYVAFVGDITATADVDCALDTISDALGALDGAVHAAYPRSSGWGTRFEHLVPEHLYEDLNRQLGGAILFSQRVLEFFRRQRRGSLVHLSSIQGLGAPRFEQYESTDMTSPAEYTAVKHGIIGLTKYLAKYYSGMGIRVNCVSPGGIRDEQPESFQARYRESCTSKGLLDSSDISGAVSFLLSPSAASITGHNLVIDDGWSL